MQPDCLPSIVHCDKLSPRPSPQHSKSLTAPLDCTNCSKQQSNPMNNYLSKWKYKDDSAKPMNIKRTRPRKQPQTTYHFPLSHCSVNTFNPNNKQNDVTESTTPPSQDSSPAESPRDSSSSSSRDSSPRDISTSPRNNYPAMSKNSPRSSPRLSPRIATREALLKHRVQRNKLNESEGQHAITDDNLSNRHHTPNLNVNETSQNDHSFDYSLTSPKKHRTNTFIPSPRDYNSFEISTICNPALDSSTSPQSSDNDDSSSDHSSYVETRSPDSRKRRSRRGSESETIEISDGESDNLTLSPRPYELVFRSPQQHPSDPLHDHSDSPGDPLGIHHHPLLLTSAHNDLAKYHLEAPLSYNDKAPTLPPLNFTRLPSIGELSLWCPTDDTSPRGRNESLRNHQSRNRSLSCHYTVR